MSVQPLSSAPANVWPLIQYDPDIAMGSIGTDFRRDNPFAHIWLTSSGTSTSGAVHNGLFGGMTSQRPFVGRALVLPEGVDAWSSLFDRLFDWWLENALALVKALGTVLADATTVRHYLHRYPDTIGAVIQSCKMARECLSGYAQLSLEVYHDPEIKDEYLVLYVRPRREVAQAVDAVENISERLAALLAHKSGWLVATVDLRPAE
jgi:hypothetical protein